MRAYSVAAILLVFLPGCGTAPRDVRPGSEKALAARPPYVDIAVNLGLKYNGDLHRLHDSLAAMGVRCGMRAMSLNAEQIVVEREDFDRVKTIVTEIIVRDRLTVRVYKSADFEEKPAASLLEVWERGKKVREEEYILYLD